jgi:hypothetical protein
MARWLVVPAGLAGAQTTMLVTPFPRRSTGLTEAEAEAIATVRHMLAAMPLPIRPMEIDAETSRAALLVEDEGQLAEQLQDYFAVPVTAPT